MKGIYGKKESIKKYFKYNNLSLKYFLYINYQKI